MTKRQYVDNTLYHDYDCVTCPLCGGKIKHPYTGEVTIEQLEEDSKCCQWMEVIDESDSTIGWTPICRNVHPYTLEEESHNYVHYDILELINSMWELTLPEKIEKTYYYIMKFYPEVKKEDIVISVCDNKLTEVYVHNSIKEMVIDLSIDDDGNIIVNPV